MIARGIGPAPLRSKFGGVEWGGWFERLFKAIPKVQTFSQTLTPASVGANSTAEQNFTVAGLITSDIVWVNKPTFQTGLFIGGYRVSATDTLSITFVNTSVGAIVPTSETYLVGTIRL